MAQKRVFVGNRYPYMRGKGRGGGQGSERRDSAADAGKTLGRQERGQSENRPFGLVKWPE